MHWFTWRNFTFSVILGGLLVPSRAYSCPLCFGSSSPRVLHAYYLSAVLLIGLAWTLGLGVCLYGFWMYRQKEEVRNPIATQTRVHRFKRVLWLAKHR